ncbi:PIR Superfamily Protein [Plasmodium ovale wallikeri]|uniref:PIR Superfamily Protein n=1 Tax=Plasmodium ovale wallikeri TaxID=864142 RepID=A0A1A9AIG5_PLAOA|nr:PIR Superfamily Protein [Plasmodium ovale wallikeri]SBT58837.1 PIR Superfamily Protein [Plasmodium ovale wallikeri]
MSKAPFSKENIYEKLFSYDIKFPNKESADYTNVSKTNDITKRCDTDDSDFSASLDQNCASKADSAETTSVVPLYVGYVLFTIILIFIFVYKFTSIGSTINSYFSKKRQHWKHFNEEENEALGNSFQNTNTELRNGLNRLFYQST